MGNIFRVPMSGIIGNIVRYITKEEKMNLWRLANERAKRSGMVDVGLIKLTSFIGGLLIAKIWNPILSFEWYWYLAALLITGIIPTYRFLRK
jgi:hypothetical protein